MGQQIIEETHSSRRQLVKQALTFAGGLIAVGPLAHAQQNMAETPSTGAEALLTYLHQEIEIKATAQRIYTALLDTKQFTAFSGFPADINPEAGGAFTLFGGLIVGRNIELVPNQRIVQAWRPTHWDAGVYSLVRFELKERAGNTQIILDHTGFPEGNFRHLNLGWYAHYWDRLKKFLA
jgi:activator of HSP90 ATPase